MIYHPKKFRSNFAQVLEMVSEQQDETIVATENLFRQDSIRVLIFINLSL